MESGPVRGGVFICSMKAAVSSIKFPNAEGPF